MNLYKFLDRAFGSLQYRSFVVRFHLQNLGKPWIPYMETHLCDHCNLNCKSCSHFCPLVTEPTFTDLEQYTRDIQTLSKKLAIRTIRLMGGEPLLHPQVNDFMRVTREAYPHSRIFIVTNGLLLQKMPNDFWETLRQYRIRIHWSKYPPLKDKFSEIYGHLKKHRALLEFGEMSNEDIECFHSFSPFSPNGTEDPKQAFKGCMSKDCVNLYRGKLYTCPACYVFRANNYFHANHEVPEGWDIYKYSGKELQNFLNKPISFCRYCHHAVHPKSFLWEVSKRRAEEWM